MRSKAGDSGFFEVIFASSMSLKFDLLEFSLDIEKKEL
jgi:hypothetical protein